MKERDRYKIIYFLSQYPEVRSAFETIKVIAERGHSIARFGDGDFYMYSKKKFLKCRCRPH